MRKPKFEVGQTVHIPIDYYDPSKTSIAKIEKIQLMEETSKVKNKSRKSTTVHYFVKFHNGTQRRFPESIIYGSKNDFYVRKRKRDKSSAQSSLTRAKKNLEKNEQILVELQEKLRAFK